MIDDPDENESSTLIADDDAAIGTARGNEEAVLSPLGAARRSFLCRTGLITAGTAVFHCVPGSAQTMRPPQPALPGRGVDASIPVRLSVNSHPYTLQLDPRTTLLDALREHLALTGTKKGCDRGQCGACTVLAGGRRINSCLALAAMYEGEAITTVEGVAPEGAGLHPMQAAFIRHDGFQCGFCTPGQICSAIAMLKGGIGRRPERGQRLPRSVDPQIDLNPMEIRERMSGNLCRCGAYAGIVAAIGDVSAHHA